MLFRSIEPQYLFQENLQDWLTDAKARDQFVIRAGSDTEVLWNDARHLKPDPVYKRAVSGHFSILYYLIFTSALLLHDFVLLLAWVFMYFFNYSLDRVLCNGLLWGHTWPLFIDRGQQSGEVLPVSINLCVIRILRLSLRFILYHCLAHFFFHTCDYLY